MRSNAHPGFLPSMPSDDTAGPTNPDYLQTEGESESQAWSDRLVWGGTSEQEKLRI